MAITSAEIHNQSFSIDRKGYDVDEVDVFLEHVADEIDGMNAQIAQLENQLDDRKFEGFDTPARVEAPVVVIMMKKNGVIFQKLVLEQEITFLL